MKKNQIWKVRVNGTVQLLELVKTFTKFRKRGSPSHYITTCFISGQGVMQMCEKKLLQIYLLLVIR